MVLVNCCQRKAVGMGSVISELGETLVFRAKVIDVE